MTHSDRIFSLIIGSISMALAIYGTENISVAFKILHMSWALVFLGLAVLPNDKQ